MTPSSGPLGFDEVARRLVDEDTGLCAHDARFAEHDVIEHIAGLAAGRLSPSPRSPTSPSSSCDSDLVCPAHPEGERVGVGTGALVDRRPPRPRRRHARASSTASPPGPAAPIADATVAESLAAAGFLGDDQASRGATLCGPGGSVRAVLAPAGYGKTAMAHAAAGCAAADGRRGAGGGHHRQSGRRARRRRAAGAAPSPRSASTSPTRALPAGTVVILDEISQTSTRDAHTVLAAVDAAPAVSCGSSATPTGARGESRRDRRRDRRPLPTPGASRPPG